MSHESQDARQTTPRLALVSERAPPPDAALPGDERMTTTFGRELPVTDLFLTAAIRAALDTVRQVLADGEGLVLIEGEQGVGKSTFLRLLLQAQGSATGLCQIDTRLALGERHVLARIAEVFGGRTPADPGALARRLAAQGRPVLIAVDNADRLSPFALRALFDLRRQVRLEGGRMGLLMMSRPGGLTATLSLPAFASYGEDGLHHVVLPPFTAEETADYVRHRSAVVGMSLELDGAQLRRLHRGARGLPRVIARHVEDLSSGRRPRPWRTRAERQRAQWRRQGLMAASAGALVLAGAAWLIYASYFATPQSPRFSIAFEQPPWQSESPPPSPVDTLPPASAAVVEESPPVAVPPAQPSAVALSAAPAAPVTPVTPVTPATTASSTPPPSPSPSPPRSSAPADADLNGRAWLMAQEPGRYTLQIASTPNQAGAANFISRHQLPGKTTAIAIRRNDQTQYLVVHGSYATAAEARRAIAALPQQIRRNEPFARSMQSLQAIAVGR